MEDDKHYPPGSEAERAATEEAAKVKAEAAEKAKADEAASAEADDTAKTDEDAEAKADEETATDQIKKRSIYDDYKDKKQEAKDAAARAQAAEARVQELEGLLNKKDDAETPKEKAQVDEEIKTFAEEQGLDPSGLTKLTEIILKRIPKSEQPEGLSKDEIEEWRTSRAAAKQEAEDRAIMAQSTQIKAQLDISDEKELDGVMKEVIRLAHSKDFHDKEVEYIVWKNQEKLSKLVSPKKPSFEAGGQGNQSSESTEVEFSGKMTPAQAAKATHGSYPKSSYEIRRGT